ncbi:hypothetical protein [Amycolatopsis sp. CA-230715]|uniref:hypothetical protein n=1 Tax=Amycolatopsis sp. CA-230715 TaxID=2745196 RepID=UPI001C033F4A|nr:hypothetical protein [Amycolatopsis sp. CA-230715]QWF78753.1 hypothetical protein HUW46_02151 [Amycolatopsis sp. CA-230715]
MLNGELESGEIVVLWETLVLWGIAPPEEWVITVRPARFEADRTPLDFEVGHYSAHDYRAFLDGELVFVVVVAEVFEGDVSLAQVEVDGLGWRPDNQKPQYVGDADVDGLLSYEDLRELVSDVLASAEREVGA